MLVLKLQTYEKQAMEYHNNCLLGKMAFECILTVQQS